MIYLYSSLDYPTAYSQRSDFVRKYQSFAFHYIATVAVVSFMILYVNGNDFLVARRHTIINFDGSTSPYDRYSPLQSEITTLISLMATVTRLAGGLWCGNILWRCILYCMEQGGISLGGVKRLIENHPPSFHHIGYKRNTALVFIFLIISFSIDFFSSVLTGSVTWEPTFTYVQGKTTMTGISQSSGGMSLYNYRKWEGTRIEVASLATAMGNMAWGSSNQSDHSAEPAMVMKRVMPKVQSLPVGSILYNVTLPYFVVDNFEWIQDPNSYLTSEQYNLLTNYKNAGTHNRDYNPYTVGSGIVGLIPDKKWGPLSGDVTPDPQVVSETRILSYKFIRLPDHGSCEYMLPAGVPPNLGIITFQLSVSTDCFLLAKLTYRAGQAECHNCKMASPAVFQTDDIHLTLLPDSLAAEALAITSFISSQMAISGYAVPVLSGGIQNMAIESLSRAYQASWMALTTVIGSKTGETQYDVAITSSKAVVTLWRLYAWLALHCCVLLFGLFFAYLQSKCQHPWVDNPAFSTLLLNNGHIFTPDIWMTSDPWDRDVTLPKGLIRLEDAGSSARRMEMDDSAHELLEPDHLEEDTEKEVV